jgi:hypothetical protein
MTIFIVCRVQDPPKMKNAVESVFPDDHFDIGHSEWLISSKGTTKEVSDKLGVTHTASDNTSGAGSAIIFSVENYFGRAPTNIWEWIKTKAEATNG